MFTVVYVQSLCVSFSSSYLYFRSLGVFYFEHLFCFWVLRGQMYVLL